MAPSNKAERICNDPARRRFLNWLSASPLLAIQANAQSIPYLIESASAADVWPALFETSIQSPEEAITLFDFERVAAQNLPPAHFGYLAGASDGMRETNRSSLDAARIRMTRLHGQGRPDTGIELFGIRYDAPFFMCPVSSLRAFHPEGELAIARAARQMNIPMAISTFSSTPIEEVNQAYRAPVWFQLYLQGLWESTVELIQRAESSGSEVLLLTLDSPARTPNSNSILFERADDRDCTLCHNDLIGQRSHKPMVANLPTEGTRLAGGASQSWELIRRLRDVTGMKILVKGIETGSDAALARQIGVDGLYVSNHGGRVMLSGRGTFECIEEVASEAGSLPLLVDSGFRPGSDVFKALALGADAVGFGRPFCWGMAAFGEAGALQAMNMVKQELSTTMIHAGAGNLSHIQREMLV